MQEVIPVVRIHASRIEEASELSLSEDASILISDPTEDLYENIEAFFAEPVDEYKDLVHHFVGFREPLEHVKDTRVGTQSLDINNKKTLERLEPQAPQKDGIGIGKGRYPGLGYLEIGRSRQGATKAEDHG